MLFIRPVELEDLDDLLQMSVEVGTGMTSMPNDEGTWLSRIILSRDTFAGEVDGNEEEGVYFLVAEDSETGKIVGTTAIYIGIGSVTPFYSYKQSLIVKYSKELKKTFETKVLHLVNDFTRDSEIGSLFLTKDYRHSSYGQFMSRCRYLMMADFPDKFSDDILAEMRGWQDANGNSPFWQSLGNKFFDLDFKNADHISATKGSQFIQDLMPKYPVYVDLLSEEAQKCIGRAHHVSAKAIHMLKKEGFHYDGYLDLFDGGPTVHCRRELIKSVRDSLLRTVEITDNFNDEQQRYIISNRNMESYRIIIELANINENTAQISQEGAKILGVEVGDEINLVAMMERK